MQNSTITTEYNEDKNTSYLYEGDFCIATLDFDTDHFESHDEMTNEEADEYHELMTNEREYEPAFQNN